MKKLIITAALVAAVFSPLAVSPWNANASEQQIEAGDVSNEQLVSYYEKDADSSVYRNGVPAWNLPIEELEKEFARVPRDKPVFINCATGAKSQEAFDIFSRKGYTLVKYLDAEISCKGEICTIKA